VESISFARGPPVRTGDVGFQGSPRPGCRSILFRLYRNEKECARERHPYRKKTELARELLDIFHGWVGAQRVEDSRACRLCLNDVPII
jgi:hypothetical protein